MGAVGERRIAGDLDGLLSGGGTVDDGLPPDCPVRPLGHKAGTYWFSDPEGQIREYRRLGEAEQVSLFCGRCGWLALNFAERKGNKGWAITEASAALIAAAVAAGWYDPDAVRGPGVWYETGPADDGTPGPAVIHLGDRLVQARWDDGALMMASPTKAGRRIGSYVYPAAPPEMAPALDRATQAEVARFEQFLCTWTWARGRAGARLYLGAVALAWLPALLERRPVVFVQAGSGCGKSALLTATALTNGRALQLEVKSAPGIRDLCDLDRGARLLILNETESKADNQRSDGVTELIRYNYTAGEGRAALHGRASVPTQLFTILGGIIPPPVDEQDANRRVVLRLLPLTASARDKVLFSRRAREAATLGPRLYRRMLWAWGRWPQTLEAYQIALADAGFDSRGIDTWATLLAGWDLIRYDDLNEDRAAWWGRRLAPEVLDKPLSIPETALIHLMTYRVDEWAGGGKRTVGEHLAEGLRKDPGGYRDDALRPIKRFGVTISVVGGVEYIAVAKDHGGLETIYRGTAFAGGGWATALRELEGADDSPHAIRFGDGTVKLKGKGEGGERARAVLLPTTLLDVGPVADVAAMASSVHGSV